MMNSFPGDADQLVTVRSPGTGAVVARTALTSALHELLAPDRFRDYCPNGLQVEGKEQVATLVTGVTACEALIDAAVSVGADAIVVHHGLFWKGDDPCVVGARRRRLLKLLQAGINVYAYHLPLDAHPELGNNAQLGAALGWRATGRFGADDLGWLGELDQPTPISELVQQIRQVMGREPTLIGDLNRRVTRVAWCSGGAQKFIEEAAAAGAELYLSGELSEPTTHSAREWGIAYVAAGHHATERGGARAVGDHLAQRFGLRHLFVDVSNPA